MYGWRSSEWLKVFCVVGLFVLEVAASGMGWREVLITNNTDGSYSYPVFTLNGDIIVGRGGGRLGTNAVVQKISATGLIQWEWTGRGEYLVAASSEGNVVTMWDEERVKVPKERLFVNAISGITGSNLWETVITNIAGGGSHWPAFDQDGNVVVTASQEYSSQGASNDVVTAIELDRTTGSIRWRTSFEMDGFKFTYLNIDEKGDVIVVASGSSDWSARAVKIDGESGTILWDWKDTTIPDWVSLPTLDLTGNVIISGGGGGTNHTAELHTAKIRGEDGKLVWRNILTNQVEGGIIGRHRSVSLHGDVISVCETVDWPWGGGRMPVVCYGAERGEKVWQIELTPPLPEDRLSPLFFERDTDGEVILGAYEASHTNRIRFWKLNAATGATIWEISRAVDREIVRLVGGRFGRFSFTSEDTGTGQYGIGLFQIGPELRTQVMGNELEVGWEVENVGWRLERLSGVLDAGEWLAVEGSAGTNSVRVPKEGGTGMFRLVR